MTRNVLGVLFWTLLLSASAAHASSIPTRSTSSYGIDGICSIGLASPSTIPSGFTETYGYDSSLASCGLTASTDDLSSQELVIFVSGAAPGEYEVTLNGGATFLDTSAVNLLCNQTSWFNSDCPFPLPTTGTSATCDNDLNLPNSTSSTGGTFLFDVPSTSDGCGSFEIVIDESASAAQAADGANITAYTATPEPGSSLLLGTGLAALCLLFRKQALQA
jgi:hypothetical protein